MAATRHCDLLNGLRPHRHHQHHRAGALADWNAIGRGWPDLALEYVYYCPDCLRQAANPVFLP